MRWPSAGPEAPSIFRPRLPDKALVARRIGLRMIEKMLEDRRGWMASGLNVGRIAINSSAIDLPVTVSPKPVAATQDPQLAGKRDRA